MHTVPISDIYQQYRIVPTLQLHMYRVAGVAQLVCENLPELSKEIKQDVISATLLHDMGNIIKFEFSRFPDFFKPEGPEYWQKVQQDFIAKYGANEHLANTKIAEEIGVNFHVRELIDAIGFSKTHENFLSPDIARKICEYADNRVSPWGVVTLEERFLDLEQRYSDRFPSEEDVKKREEFSFYAREIEKNIFAKCQIEPADVTEEAIQPLLENLKNFEIITI